MKQVSKEKKDLKKSPLKTAYLLLNATSPGELSTKYTDEDQKLMKSQNWDYRNTGGNGVSHHL